MKKQFINPKSMLCMFSPSQKEVYLMEKYRKYLNGVSNEKLVKHYNELELFFDQEYLIYITAVHYEFLYRFNQSPLMQEGEVGLIIGRPIFYSEHLNDFGFIFYN